MTGAPKRLRLRPLRTSDEDDLLRIHRTPEVARWWDQPVDGFPFDDPDCTRLVIEVDGRVAGMVQFEEESDPKYRHASLDLFLDPGLHGRGLGTKVVRRVVTALIEDRGHHRITIDPAAANAAAIRAYEKAGFTRVGLLRNAERDSDGRGWHDQVLMEFVVEPGKADPEAGSLLGLPHLRHSSASKRSRSQR